MTESMGPYLAVFNDHLNNAHDRALAVLEVESKVWAQEIRECKERGIMGIFSEEPTPATRRYVELVTGFVNEGAGDD